MLGAGLVWGPEASSETSVFLSICDLGMALRSLGPSTNTLTCWAILSESGISYVLGSSHIKKKEEKKRKLMGCRLPIATSLNKLSFHECPMYCRIFNSCSHLLNPRCTPPPLHMGPTHISKCQAFWKSPEWACLCSQRNSCVACLGPWGQAPSTTTPTTGPPKGLCIHVGL